MSEVLLKINFWQAKQLEYWLKDNYPGCNIFVVNNDGYCAPEDKEYYKILGDIDIDLACMLQLKYGKDVKQVQHGKT